MPYPNEHSARIRQPNQFDEKTYRRAKGGKATLPGSGLIDIPSSIAIIWGKLKTANKPADNPLVQALRFPIKNYTEAQAKKWLKDNEIKYIRFEPAEETKDMKAQNLYLTTDVNELSVDEIRNQISLKKLHELKEFRGLK